MLKRAETALSVFERVGILAILIVVVPFAYVYSASKLNDINRLIERSGLLQMQELFSVSYAELKHENGKWVVYSDGRVLKDFEGSFRVCLKNLSTGRSYWTCEWADWFDYSSVVDTSVSQYRQPETLEWWANISEKQALALGSAPKIMTTCWKALVEGHELEPVCVISQWAGSEPPD